MLNPETLTENYMRDYYKEIDSQIAQHGDKLFSRKRAEKAEGGKKTKNDSTASDIVDDAEATAAGDSVEKTATSSLTIVTAKRKNGRSGGKKNSSKNKYDGNENSSSKPLPGKITRHATRNYVFGVDQWLRPQLTIAPNFFSERSKLYTKFGISCSKEGGKHNSQIEIPSCFMHIMSRFCSCFFGESEIWFTIWLA